MERRTILIGLLVFLFISVDCEPRKRGGFGGGWGSSTKSKSQSRQTTNTRSQPHGSQPGKIGWNVPPKTNNQPKPSAPVQDHVQKSSATQVHSGYPNNGRGYNRNGVQNYRSPQLQNNRSPQYQYNRPPQYQYNRPTQYQYNRPQFQNSRAGQQHYPPSQSAYNPNSRPPPYSPPGSQPYGSHQPYGGGYHAPSGGYHPQSGGYNAPGYNLGHSSAPGAGYNPTIGNPQPVILQSQPYKPGIGQLAKEAFVYAGVSAGVNAAVNRLLPGGIYGNGGSVWGGGSGHSGAAGVNPATGPGVTNTHITYNNYYNNGTNPETGAPMPGTDPAAAQAASPALNAAPPASVAGAPPQPDAANPSPPPPPPQDPGFPPSPSGYVVTNEDLQKLAEDMYSKEKNNAYKDMTMNLQGHKMDASSTDDASAPFLTVKKEAYEYPTVKNVLALHDNYELDVRTKESVTPEERREENELLEAFLATDVMQTAMKYLSDKGYIANDEYEFKDALRRIWFSQFKRIDGEPSSSGFETVFLAEQFDSEIIGLHNWIYFAKQEESGKLNYLGYIKKADLGSNGAIVKLRLQLNNVLQPLTTVFVGTSPELEMALYTLCFYIRPNSVCPVALGGTNFMIVSNRVNYFGKDILVSAYPEI